MKKLMFAVAAIAAGIAVADVTSANIVGYNNLTHNEDGVRSPLFGLCFTPVDGSKTTKLGDFKPVDGMLETETDCIQVINPTSLAASELFTYVDKTTADAIAEDEEGKPGDFDWAIGWWDMIVGVLEDDGMVNDYPVNVGDGFMGYFEAGNEISFTSAGEAPTKATSFTPNTDGTRSPVFANYIPREIPLKYFTPVDGMLETETDCIQVINPTSLAASELFTYVDKTTADAIAEDEEGKPGDFDWAIGWWDMIVGVLEDDGMVNDYPVKAGFGFMGYFEAGNEIEFQLPSSTATLD